MPEVTIRRAAEASTNIMLGYATEEDYRIETKSLTATCAKNGWETPTFPTTDARSTFLHTREFITEHSSEMIHQELLTNGQSQGLISKDESHLLMLLLHARDESTTERSCVLNGNSAVTLELRNSFLNSGKESGIIGLLEEAAIKELPLKESLVYSAAARLSALEVQLITPVVARYYKPNSSEFFGVHDAEDLLKRILNDHSRTEKIPNNIAVASSILASMKYISGAVECGILDPKAAAFIRVFVGGGEGTLYDNRYHAATELDKATKAAFTLAHSLSSAGYQIGA